MDESVFRGLRGVNGDGKACVGAIWRRTLYALKAFRASDEHRLAFSEAMKPFKNVNSAHRDLLHRFTKGARIGDLGEQPIE